MDTFSFITSINFTGGREGLSRSGRAKPLPRAWLLKHRRRCRYPLMAGIPAETITNRPILIESRILQVTPHKNEGCPGALERKVTGSSYSWPPDRTSP